MTMKDEIERAGPLVDRMNAAIRDNPLAAGLIGAGMAWMLFGGAKGFGAMAGVAQSAASKAGSAATSAGNAAASGLSKMGTTAANGISDAASVVADSVASIVPKMSIPETDRAFEVAANAESAVEDKLHSALAAGREYGSVLQTRLADSLERQPLLLGAIGLAIGAGIASAFPTTETEGELMGAQATATRDKLETFADDVKDRAKQVLSNVKDEALRQGLSPDAAQNAAAAVGQKVKTVAGAGRDVVAQRVGGK